MQIDKTKESSRKCEHCKYYSVIIEQNEIKGCLNTKSQFFRKGRFWWNSCKGFKWKESSDADSD